MSVTGGDRPRPWDAAAAILAAAGVGAVVGLPSDEYGLLDAARYAPDLDVVVVREHSLGAGIAAGYALMSGRPAVLTLASGPPFAQAMVGLLEAASVCAPVVVVTTRIASANHDRGGFQELDQASLSSVFARWHTVVDTPDRLEWALRQAVRRSINGRPGVSVVEVSDEVARGAPPRPDPDRGPITRIRSVAADDEVDRAGAVLAAASRPMVVAGGGARAAGAGAALHALAEALDALVMTTASGRGVLPEDRPYNGGLVGLYATPPFDALADRADVVVAVGTRLEETARTGWGGLARARLVHLDADPEAFGSWTEPTVALAGDAALTVARLVERAPRPAVAVAQARAAWRQEIAEAQRAAVGMRVDWTVSPTRAVFAALSEVFGDAAIAQENGMHDLWGYHYPVLRLGPAMTVLTPGEQTMMGFGVASAVGASVAAPRRPVVAVTGDGAFAASRVALHALDGLPRGITVIVLDDQGYGWPRLLRHAAGDDIALTRFATSAIAPPLTGGVRVAEPADGAGLVTALHEARRANDLGTSVVVRIVVADDDVPVGVQRLIGKQRPAEQHDAS